MADVAQLTIEVRAGSVDEARRKLDELARTGGRVERETQTQATRMGSSFLGLAGRITAVGGALSAAFATSAIVRAVKEAEAASAQLDAALRSTGGAAGVTGEQIRAYAAELQRTTTVSDDAVIAMNAQLLAFDRIQGDTFKRATAAIVDLSVRMGIDLKSAALQVGKALQDPADGLAMLARSGVKFSEDQELVIKHLAETNRLAEAQSVILGALETKFGGAGEAARNTFGGALTGLGNAFDDLLEGEGKLPALTEQINGLTNALNSQETKSGFSQLIGYLDQLLALIIRSNVASLELAGNLAKIPARRASDAAAGLGLIFSPNPSSADQIRGAGGLGSGPMDLGGMFGRTSVPIAQPTVTYTPGIDPTAALAEQLRMRQILNELTRGGDIDKAPSDYVAEVEDYARAVQDAQRAQEQWNHELDDWLVGNEKQFDAWAKSGKRATDEMTIYAETAARNMQSAFADFLFDPFKDGLDGMLRSFLQTIQRMLAEQAAAKVFGSTRDGGLGLGDILSGIFTGGGFASGGWTGNGPTNKPAGIVHGQEFVMPASAVRRIGLSNLESMRQGGGAGRQVNYSPVFNISADGAGPGVVEQIRGMIEMVDAKSAERLAHFARYGEVTA